MKRVIGIALLINAISCAEFCDSNGLKCEEFTYKDETHETLLGDFETWWKMVSEQKPLKACQRLELFDI